MTSRISMWIDGSSIHAVYRVLLLCKQCWTWLLLMCRFFQQTEKQKEALRRQTTIAVELNLPVVIHSRDSEYDIIDELERVCWNSLIFVTHLIHVAWHMLWRCINDGCSSCYFLVAYLAFVIIIRWFTGSHFCSIMLYTFIVIKFTWFSDFVDIVSMLMALCYNVHKNVESVVCGVCVLS